MRWPTPQDYNEAVQCPSTSFSDPDLRQCVAERSQLGLPRVQSGSFASVYRLRGPSGDWAVRCFLKPTVDQHERYARLTRFISSDDLPYTVDFHYQPEGIIAGGMKVPILKMAWVNGYNLDLCLQHYMGRSHFANGISKAFFKMMQDLRRAGVSHGDLQHGNIMLSNGELRLVDYDGMFVPELSGFQSPELGHRNFQHPRRTALHFDNRLDNFSAWIIYASLSTLSIDRSLWQRIGGGDECLLFRQKDFTEPDHSLILALLAQHPSRKLRLIGELTQTLLDLDPLSTPFLAELAGIINSDELMVRLQRSSGREVQPVTSKKAATEQAAGEQSMMTKTKLASNFWTLADQQYDSGNWAQAAERYSKIIARETGNMSLGGFNSDNYTMLIALKRLAICYINQQQSSLACAAAEQALVLARAIFRSAESHQVFRYQCLLARAQWIQVHDDATKQAIATLASAVRDCADNVNPFDFQVCTQAREQGLYDFDSESAETTYGVLGDDVFARMCYESGMELLRIGSYSKALACAQRAGSINRLTGSASVKIDSTRAFTSSACDLLTARCEQELNYPVVQVVWRYGCAIRGLVKACGKQSEQVRLALRHLSFYYLALGMQHEGSGRVSLAAKEYWKALETYVRATPSFGRDDVLVTHVIKFAERHHLMETWRQKGRRKEAMENRRIQRMAPSR